MCSLMPMAKLPRPSKLFGFKPRKSRTRGSAMLIRRSRNSYMRAPRRVTFAPIGIPSRTLKPAMELRALVMTAFWPEIAARSAAATVGFFESAVASPTPMLMTIFSSLGIIISFAKENSSFSAPRIRDTYSVLRRGSYFASAIDHISRTLGYTHLLAVDDREANAGRLAVFRGDRDVRQVNGRFFVDDAGFLRLSLALVTLHHVDAAHQCAIFLRQDLKDFAGTALVLAGQYDNAVALADLFHRYRSFRVLLEPAR